MSIWTHVTGTIRVDDFNKTDLGKLLNADLPTGSEGSLHYEIFKENALIKTICFYGDLRDFCITDCGEIRDWWMRLPSKFGKHCSIRQGILLINPEDNVSIILTDKDMINGDDNEIF